MLVINQPALPKPELLGKLNAQLNAGGPRYTSYPTADRFVEAFEHQQYADWLRRRRVVAGPLALYIHLPFCENICYYCACNKVVTKDHSRSQSYLDTLEREMALVAQHLRGSREVVQLHLGGGTPTFLTDAELARLMQRLRDYFVVAAHAEVSIEIDPRSAPASRMPVLVALGFNRISLGVQDFDPAVQAAVNREQSFELTRDVVEAARRLDVQSINLDLIYGLPQQSQASFTHTLKKVLELAPDRLALYHYAHLPERFKPQRRIDTQALPSSEEKLLIMLNAIEQLGAAGYQHIGMDHFAKREDELAIAQSHGRLQRNFMGYSTQPDGDLLGLGVSAISKCGPTYSQNARDINDYTERVMSGVLPTARGLLLDRDDLLRRAVIMALMCQFDVSKESINAAHLIDFDHYFRREIEALNPYIEAGLIENTHDWLTVLPAGKLLVRAMAMVFDRYLQRDRNVSRYSKIV